MLCDTTWAETDAYGDLWAIMSSRTLFVMCDVFEKSCGQPADYVELLVIV